MPPLAFSALDALLGVGLAAAGFVVVALVCVGVLAVLHVVLPSTDSGAAELDRLHAGSAEDAEQPVMDPEPHPSGLDTEANA